MHTHFKTFIYGKKNNKKKQKKQKTKGVMRAWPSTLSSALYTCEP